MSLAIFTACVVVMILLAVIGPRHMTVWAGVVYYGTGMVCALGATASFVVLRGAL